MMMLAKDLVRDHGKALIGRTVKTRPMGEYPGGKSVITEIAPDDSAPEIVFQVRHPTFGEIGVFANELVSLMGKRSK